LGQARPVSPNSAGKESENNLTLPLIEIRQANTLL
jgi:hypothetical protein